MKGFTRNEEWINNGKRKMGEQVVPSPTPRKINMRGGYILFWKLEGKSKISAGTLFANKTLWCYCCCCCCCHYAWKAKMPSNGLDITGTVYETTKKWSNCPKNIGAILTEVHWDGGQSMPEMLSWPQTTLYLTLVSWQTPLSSVIPLIEVSLCSLTSWKYECVLDAF